MSRLPPLRPHHWTLPRYERRWYSPLRRVGCPCRSKNFLTIYTGQVRIARCFDGEQVDAVRVFPSADVRAARRNLRAYLRRVGVPGRIIREVCGGLHRGGRCWVVPCPSAAWRAAMAEVLA